MYLHCIDTSLLKRLTQGLHDRVGTDCSSGVIFKEEEQVLPLLALKVWMRSALPQVWLTSFIDCHLIAAYNLEDEEQLAGEVEGAIKLW